MAALPFALLRPVSVFDSGTNLRGSTGTYWDKTGALQTAGVNVPRFTYDPATLAPQGLMVEAAATNLVLQSNALANAAWGKIGTLSAVAAQYTSKGLSLDRVTRGGTAAGSYIQSGTIALTANQPYVASKIIRADGSNSKKYALRLSGIYPNRVDAVYDFSTDTVVGVTGGTFTGLSTGRVLLGDGCVLFWVTGTPTVSEAGVLIAGPTDNVSIGGWEGLNAADSSVLAGEAQFETGTTPTSRIRTTTVTITRAADNNNQLMTSNVPETPGTSDPAAWNGATPYAINNQVSRIVVGGIHNIYQRIVAGTTATAPELDTTNWVYVGPTQRWKMFDAANETQTQQVDDVQVAIKPGSLVDNLAFDNVDADSIRLVVPGTVYDQTIALKTRPVTNWFQHFFEPFTLKKTAVFTGLPLLTTNTLNIIVRKGGGAVAKVGSCVPGLSRVIGYAEYGAGVGIIDYSTKTTDQFGSTSVVKRSYSKRMNVSVVIANSDLDSILDLLANYRSTPVVWIGAGSLYGALVVYGYYRSFDIVIAYPTQSRCNLEIEGLT